RTDRHRTGPVQLRRPRPQLHPHRPRPRRQHPKHHHRVTVIGPRPEVTPLPPLTSHSTARGAARLMSERRRLVVLLLLLGVTAALMGWAILGDSSRPRGFYAVVYGQHQFAYQAGACDATLDQKLTSLRAHSTL